MKSDQHLVPAETPGTDRRNGAGRKRYRTPRLIEYGSVAKLTQNTTGSGADGGGNAAKMMSCL